MSDPNLVTTCNFNGRDYFVKMNTTNNILELIVTDKQSGEDWQCCYEASYIENITQKTGNFKQFGIFIAMLKSGLLKTSNCVYLDLMTFDDLDALRNHRVRGPYSSYHLAQTKNNRRYLILTYTVEFDRIHYPLPLEYCGPPDPQILQQHIIRLEEEISLLKEQNKHPSKHKNESKLIVSLQKRIEDLTEENQQLHEETRRLNYLLEKRSKNKDHIIMLQNAIKCLEKSVLSERKSHHQLVEKLRRDKIGLTREIEQIKRSEKSAISKLNSNSASRERCTKRMSDPGSKIQSRSPSPRISRSEKWEKQSPITQTRRTRTKHRKKIDSDSETSRHPSPGIRLSPSFKPQQINTNQSSRSASASSRSSSASTKHDSSIFRRKTRAAPVAPSTKVSELDFSALQNKILSLQKMLDVGLEIG